MVLPGEKKSLNQPNPKRDPALLPSGLERSLFSYAIAASSAGVALLACSQPAEATVVATQVNIPIPINGGLVQFDINGDGLMDFGISATSQLVCPTSARRYHGGARVRPPLLCASIGKLSVDPTVAANKVVAEGVWEDGHCAAALGKGITIGASRRFAPGDLAMGFFSGVSGEGTAACNWIGGDPKHYLGVLFTNLTGDTYFGWVRVEVQQFNDQFTATITGCAYESTPSQSIITGAISGPHHADATQPAEILRRAKEAASLGRLAQGAGGLTAWRRDEELLAA
jgi:hypothetical protein